MRNMMTIRKHIELHLTADDWQLYDKEGREHAATLINQFVEKKLNAGEPNKAVDVLYAFSQFGAADSEGLYMLEQIINQFEGARV